MKRIISSIFVIILLMAFVSAGNSSVGVEYDNELIGQFLLSKWVHVTIDIKDTSNITILSKNSPDFESRIQQRTEILSEISDSVLLTLQGNEFQLEGKLTSGRGFYGNITKGGFNKLLKDTRVRKIYAEKEIHTNLYESAPLINANDVWADYNGTGQTICIIDTGINYSRDDLGGCFGSGCKIVGGNLKEIINKVLLILT